MIFKYRDISSFNESKSCFLFVRQFRRVLENIVPFVFIGFFSGVLVQASDFLNNVEAFRSFLRYSNISLDVSVAGEKMLFEGFAPYTLVFLLISLLYISAFHRIFKGAVEKHPKESKGFIYTIENFASLLAISWLGAMIGVSVSALLFLEVYLAIRFMAISIFPLLYLFEIVSASWFIHWEGLHKFPEYIDDNTGWRIGTRLEGFVVLAFGTAILVYHDQFIAFMEGIGEVVILFIIE